VHAGLHVQTCRLAVMISATLASLTHRHTERQTAFDQLYRVAQKSENTQRFVYS